MKRVYTENQNFFPSTFFLYRCFSFSIEKGNKPWKCMYLQLHNDRRLGFVVHRVFCIVLSSSAFPFIELQTWIQNKRSNLFLFHLNVTDCFKAFFPLTFARKYTNKLDL